MLEKRNELRKKKSGPGGISSNDNVTGVGSRQVPKLRDKSWLCSGKEADSEWVDKHTNIVAFKW